MKDISSCKNLKRYIKHFRLVFNNKFIKKLTIIQSVGITKDQKKNLMQNRISTKLKLIKLEICQYRELTLRNLRVI